MNIRNIAHMTDAELVRYIYVTDATPLERELARRLSIKNDKASIHDSRQLSLQLEGETLNFPEVA